MIPVCVSVDLGTTGIMIWVHAPENLPMYFIFLPDVFYRHNNGPVQLGYKNIITGIYTKLIYETCIRIQEDYR